MHGWAIRLPIGLTSSDIAFFDPYRPTILSLANELEQLGIYEKGANRFIPAPSGFSLATSAGDNQLQLVLSESYTRRFRRVFGYIADIQMPLPAPAQLLVDFQSVGFFFFEFDYPPLSFSLEGL